LDYFGGSVTYLDGGAATGFQHVEPSKDVPHLYKIKGRMNSGMTMTQEKLSKSSLNSGDSFILYANSSSVWIWHGASSNPDEKARANRQGENMCTEGTVVTLDQGQGDEEQAEFWAYLEDDGDIAEADEADEEVEEFVPILFKVRDDGEAEQVATAETVNQRFGPPESKFDRALLDESGVFLLDAGWEVFLWNGKESGRDSKFAGMALADSYMVCFMLLYCSGLVHFAWLFARHIRSSYLLSQD
jgi:gelsolin